MEILINLLFILSFSIIVESHIEPWEVFKYKFGLAWNSVERSKIKIVDILLKLLRHLLNCSGCISFWTTLIMFPSWYGFKLGLIMYIITSFISKKINKVIL